MAMQHLLIVTCLNFYHAPTQPNNYCSFIVYCSLQKPKCTHGCTNIHTYIYYYTQSSLMQKIFILQLLSQTICLPSFPWFQPLCHWISLILATEWCTPVLMLWLVFIITPCCLTVCKDLDIIRIATQELYMTLQRLYHSPKALWIWLSGKILNLTSHGRSRFWSGLLFGPLLWQLLETLGNLTCDLFILPCHISLDF